MLATSRSFLSCLLVAMMVLALTSSTVEAKKCKAKKNSKNSQANLAAASGSSTTSVSSSGSYSGGKFFKHGKAGLSGGQSMQWLKNSVYWMNDWTPDPFARNSWAKDTKTVEGVAMLWGLGRLGHDDDVQRFNAFQKMKCGAYPYVAYLNEFDFQGVGSSGKISMNDAVAGWEKYIAPHRNCGAKLISPSCAMQDHETMCTEFVKSVKTKPDAISVHIFKDTVAGVKKVVDHYRTLGYPIVITELACINYEGGAQDFCTQAEINAWWPEVIKMLEADDDVVGYAPSDAANGPHASFTSGNGLSTTGTLLRNVLSGIKK